MAFFSLLFRESVVRHMPAQIGIFWKDRSLLATLKGAFQLTGIDEEVRSLFLGALIIRIVSRHGCFARKISKK